MVYLKVYTLTLKYTDDTSLFSVVGDVDKSAYKLNNNNLIIDLFKVDQLHIYIKTVYISLQSSDS